MLSSPFREREDDDLKGENLGIVFQLLLFFRGVVGNTMQICMCLFSVNKKLNWESQLEYADEECLVDVVVSLFSRAQAKK